jgi:uncharacterized protein YggE
MKKLLLIVFYLFMFSLYGQTYKANEFVAVIGEATQTFLPDLIRFHFSIDVVEKKQAEAVKKLNEQANLFIDKVIILGISPQSIKLSQYNLQEAFDYSSDKMKKLGYEASESLEIEMKYSDERFNQFIDSISGTKFSNISFTYELTFSDSLINEIRNVLIRKASDNATQIAKLLADSRNIVLGDIYSIEYTRNVASLYGVEFIPPPPPPPSMLYKSDSAPQIRANRISLKGVENTQQVRIVFRINNAR